MCLLGSFLSRCLFQSNPNLPGGVTSLELARLLRSRLLRRGPRRDLLDAVVELLEVCGPVAALKCGGVHLWMPCDVQADEARPIGGRRRSHAGGGAASQAAAPAPAPAMADAGDALSAASAPHASPASPFFADAIDFCPAKAVPPNYLAHKRRVSLISFFNHKGGVAKTTNAYTFGWGLASKGFRVGLIDCDQQCNLTQLALRTRLEASGHTFESFNGALPNPSDLAAALEPAETESGLKPAVVVPIATFSAPAAGAGGAAAAAAPPLRNGALFLVPGSDNLSKFEKRLSQADVLMIAAPMSSAHNVPGAPYHLALMTAAAYDLDFILFDLSPNIGPFNSTVLSCSDFFIVPCQPEYFTERALAALCHRIPEMVRETSRLRGLQPAGSRYKLPDPRPMREYPF